MSFSLAATPYIEIMLILRKLLRLNEAVLHSRMQIVRKIAISAAQRRYIALIFCHTGHRNIFAISLFQRYVDVLSLQAEI